MNSVLHIVFVSERHNDFGIFVFMLLFHFHFHFVYKSSFYKSFLMYVCVCDFFYFDFPNKFLIKSFKIKKKAKMFGD